MLGKRFFDWAIFLVWQLLKKSNFFEVKKLKNITQSIYNAIFQFKYIDEIDKKLILFKSNLNKKIFTLSIQ